MWLNGEVRPDSLRMSNGSYAITFAPVSGNVSYGDKAIVFEGLNLSV